MLNVGQTPRNRPRVNKAQIYWVHCTSLPSHFYTNISLIKQRLISPVNWA